jgi:hypothetical protein
VCTVYPAAVGVPRITATRFIESSYSLNPPHKL